MNNQKIIDYIAVNDAELKRRVRNINPWEYVMLPIPELGGRARWSVDEERFTTFESDEGEVLELTTETWQEDESTNLAPSL